jgi:hypothetical protein
MARVTRPPLDPARGAEAAKELKRLGAKRILIKAAELGYITEVRCGMPKCFCPEELGGAWHFEPVTAELSDWMPTFEHSPIPRREGGRESVENAVLAHRLCNRLDFSISDGRPHGSDLERIRKAREAAAGS